MFINKLKLYRRLCEVMQVNPVPTLMCIMFYANLGGALTLIGDPPNVIIGTNKDVIASVS